MNLEPVIQREVGQKENIYDIQKNGTDEAVCRAGIEMQTQNQHVDAAEEGEGGPKGKSSTDLYTLPCVKQTASGKLLHSTQSLA